MASSEALARAWADKDSAADAFSLAAARRLVEGANPILIPMVLGRPADFEYHEDIRGGRLHCWRCSVTTNPFYDDVAVVLMPCCGSFLCISCYCDIFRLPEFPPVCDTCGMHLPSTRQECERLLFGKAAKGVKFAQHFLGMHHCGMGPAESTSVVAKPAPKLGLTLLERAAETSTTAAGGDGTHGKGYVPSARVLARLYAVGHCGAGIGKDLVEAYKILTSSCLEDFGKDPFHLIQQAHLCYDLRDWISLVPCLEVAASAGHFEASYWLAHLYHHKGNKYLYYKFLKLAAEQGHIGAIGKLGRCYLGSKSKPRNMIKECFRLVAEKGAYAKIRGNYCYYLASMYYEDGDDAGHVKWLTRSSDEGNGEASFKLSAYYLSGSHVEANNNKAADYLCRAGELLGGVAYLAWLNRSGARFWDRKDWDKSKRRLVSIHPPIPVDGIQVFVKNLGGKSVTICIKLSDRVSTFKENIYDKEAIPPDQQRLVFSGKELEDNKLISAYNIERDSTIHLSLRLISASKIICTLPNGDSIYLETSRFDSVRGIKSKLEAVSAKRGLQYLANEQRLLQYVKETDATGAWRELQDADLVRTFLTKATKGTLRINLHLPSRGATLLLFVEVETQDPFETNGANDINENIWLDATPDTAIETVESNVAKTCDIDPDRILLRHRGPLIRGTLIGDYDIKDGDKLFAQVGIRVRICPRNVRSNKDKNIIGNFELVIDGNIDNLKRQIELRHSIPVKEQIICIESAQGEGEVRAEINGTLWDLSDYGVKDGSTLYLYDSASSREENDIKIVMSRASCSRAKAIAALKENEGDLVNAGVSLEPRKGHAKEQSQQKSKKKSKKSKKKKSGGKK